MRAEQHMKRCLIHLTTKWTELRIPAFPSEHGNSHCRVTGSKLGQPYLEGQRERSHGFTHRGPVDQSKRGGSQLLLVFPVALRCLLTQKVGHAWVRISRYFSCKGNGVPPFPIRALQEGVQTSKDATQCSSLFARESVHTFPKLSQLHMPDRIQTKTTIQTTCLHWRNDSKWNNNEVGANNVTRAAKTITIKQAIKNARWASRRELADESSTKLCSLWEYSQQSQGQGLAPSS